MSDHQKKQNVATNDNIVTNPLYLILKMTQKKKLTHTHGTLYTDQETSTHVAHIHAHEHQNTTTDI